MAATLLMAAAVQCVVSPGGSPCVRATTRAATSGPSGGMRAGRVLSRRSPSTPSCAKRPCQRKTTVLDTPASSMIACVPSPSALSNTMRARHRACLSRHHRPAGAVPSLPDTSKNRVIAGFGCRFDDGRNLGGLGLGFWQSGGSHEGLRSPSRGCFRPPPAWPRSRGSA